MRIPVLSRLAEAWRDLCAVLATSDHSKYLIALISILITGGIVGMFYLDSANIPYPERITYVQNWPANRTDAQIKADQQRDETMKKEAQREKQAAYKRLADQLGIK